MINLDLIFGIVTFALIVNLMIFVILFARSRLVSTGDVTIEINGDQDKVIKVPAGGKLLQTLASENLFLSSACGGGGTCSQCRCQVFEGGGSILSTEEAHFNNKEKREGWRLSCQVPVKADMKITVPDEVFGVKKWETTVISNDNVATFIKELVLKLPEGENVGFEAGGPILILKSHHLLEKHVLTKWQQFQKDQLSNFYGMQIHEGNYLDPVIRDIESFFNSSQSKVTGDVFVTLSPYRFQLNGIESKNDLMNLDFGSYGEQNNKWSAQDAKGFIKISSNQNKIYQYVNKEEKN